MRLLLHQFCVSTILLTAPAMAAAQATDQRIVIGGTESGDTAIAELTVDSQVTLGTLSNGMRYYIRANEEPEDRVELRLVVKAGSLQEDEDQRGVAHFLEHMAFNGTEHFEKHDLVSYLESIGMRFGPDLNASTSYDHTLYKLTIPTDVAGALETAIQILEDWARGIRLNEDEIDAERGVVLAEWRGRLGAGKRVRAHTDSVMFGDSRFLVRRPIGTPESIKSMTRDELADFYEKWYRPDLMAVVVVGNVDKARVESVITEQFSDFEAPDDESERVEYTLPTHASTLVSVVTDPELTGSKVELIRKYDPAPINGIQRRRNEIVHSIFASIVNKRLREIATTSGAPFLGASTDFGGYVGGMNVHTVVSASVRDGELLEGLRAALTEVERIAQYGITDEELAREKRARRSRYRQAVVTRSEITSSSRAASYVRHFLTGRTPASIEETVDLALALLEDVTKEDVAVVARDWERRENLVLVALLPEKEGLEPPTEEELLAVLEDVSGTRLSADGSGAVIAGSGDLLPTLPTPGSIVDERVIPGVRIAEWTLSNGARVLLKPTDFAPDELLFSGYSWGGTSVVPDDELLDAVLARSLPSVSGLGSFSSTELRNAVVGKLVSVGINIGAYSQSISGQSTIRDLETFLKLVYLHFTAPRLDRDAIRAWKHRRRTVLDGRAANPKAHFTDTLTAILSQRHPRRRTLTVADIDSIDPGNALQIYQERFADVGSFTFVIVGAFQPDSIRQLIERYIGGLPAEPGGSGWRDTGVRPPPGTVEKEFRFGREPRARTAIVFNGRFTHSEDEQAAFGAMANILNTRLRDRLREALGGTYSVHVHPEIKSIPERLYSIHISFDSAPDRVGEMRKTVRDEIQKLRENGPTREEVDQVRQEFARQVELAVKNNSFWMHMISGYDQMGRPLADLATYGQAFQELSVELIHDMSRKYLDFSRHVRVTQLPAR